MDKSFASEDQGKISKYVTDLFKPEDRLLAEVRQRAEAGGLPAIHVGRMDGLHIEVLARAFGARKVVEIGTLAGYSGVCLLARNGSCRASSTPSSTNPNMLKSRAKLSKKPALPSQVELFVGPAVENLAKIESQGPFDLVFIDADKVSYPQYLKWAADHLRVGGVVLGDNTFAWGGIADDHFEDAEEEAARRALQAFNRDAAQGGRFRSTILPTGEGLTVGVKVR